MDLGEPRECNAASSAAEWSFFFPSFSPSRGCLLELRSKEERCAAQPGEMEEKKRGGRIPVSPPFSS